MSPLFLNEVQSIFREKLVKFCLDFPVSSLQLFLLMWTIQVLLLVELGITTVVVFYFIQIYMRVFFFFPFAVYPEV